MNQIRALKAPELDGMLAIFYQFYMDMVQEELWASVIHFFRIGFMLKQLNHSFIVLLPKVEPPSCIEQYRPISLCNIAYKLKGVLDKLISPYQATFVPERLIQENIILGQELLHLMKAKQGRKGLVALKLDMAKVYDQMEWGFLLHVLKCFDFGE